MLEVAPWTGRPHNKDHPDAPVRTCTFGPHSEGMAVYVIIDDLRRVDLLVVVWLGIPADRR